MTKVQKRTTANKTNKTTQPKPLKTATKPKTETAETTPEKGRVFEVGDEVYFNKYTREVHQKFLKSGSVYYVKGRTTNAEGATMYELENKKGEYIDSVLPVEIKIKRAVGTVKSDAEAKEKAKAEKAASKPKKERLNKESAKRVVQSDEERAAKLDRAFAEREDKQKLEFLDGMQFGLTDELTERITVQGCDPLTLAQEVHFISEDSDFQLGGILAYIYTEDLYKTRYGYNRSKGGFNAFIQNELKIPGFQWRKCRRLMNVYLVFTSFGIEPSVLRELGMIACQMIAEVRVEKSVHDLIAYMREKDENGKPKHTIRDLTAELKMNYKSKTGVTEEDVNLETGAKVKFKHQTFSFVEDDFPVVEAALKSLANQYPDNADNPAKLMFMLCSQYLNDVQAESGTITEADFIRHGQAMFAGKEVLIRDMQTGQVSNPAYADGSLNLYVAPQGTEQATETATA